MDIDILKADGACDGYEGGHDTDHWRSLNDIRKHLVTWSPMILIPGRRTCILASPEPGSSEMFMRILKDNKLFGFGER